MKNFGEQFKNIISSGDVVGFIDDIKKEEKKKIDLKHLTEISEKNNQKQELTKDDLRFLYQINFKIENLSEKEDQQIQEIISTRDVKSDVSMATGFSKEEITENWDYDWEKADFKKGIKYHYGDFDLDSTGVTSAKEVRFPETLNGNLFSSSIISAEGLKLPKTIRGILSLQGVNSPKGLDLPADCIEFDLRGLTSAEGIKFPEIVLNLHLGGITTAVGLKLPRVIQGSLNLESLKFAEGLTLPEIVDGDIFLTGLISSESLNFPKNFKGGLYLNDMNVGEKEKLQQKYPNLDIRYQVW